MSYVNTREILDKASKEYYGVAAFNINNLEFLQAILAGAAEKKSPAIIETSEGAIKYAGMGDYFKGARIFVNMVKEFANDLDIPVALHLDHGKDFNIIMACIKAGYSSVMIDASHYDFEDNLRITKDVARIAHAAGVSVEAELGQLAGIEDNVEAAENVLVNVDQAEKFCAESEIDFFAPAIGTSHGAFKFKGEAKLDYDRLKKVKEITGKPLVLHGASSVVQEYVKIAEEHGADFGGSKGVPSDVLKETVKFGINKVNTDTDLRIAYIAGLREYLDNDSKQFDPRKYYKVAMDYTKQVVMDRIDILGSAGKI
ncbi:class II fructose-1,6-bisphosphate aldolase [Oceanotoga sp. DSM 15011]|jgi:fructose-bisphosphate aldolase class II|uniref:Fructose-bisphosphate aldolase class II n=1 Tax=Oceanotoga teriensis TaxID=515440 RepID=A0AA45C5B2_9BACT|nr:MULTISPECIES: class II fructose-1,6-bisphosphate aldolase [Oceanotoga]MDN5343151.1 fructose-bisphosphate aldolase, class [Oceanotoga sp.]MDO7976137.1 class II fructose-1,6-bisphosphate aldolase [Oceanotoga teriensis]PWJ88489.1 fructose-bisphosphate aldolase class II [Oceanotoga teriensis]UYP00973.1 class II fructose-1,6-bisphosphate aldolase [Oceanotoga sp. DSM 15011]